MCKSKWKSAEASRVAWSLVSRVAIRGHATLEALAGAAQPNIAKTWVAGLELGDAVRSAVTTTSKT